MKLNIGNGRVRDEGDIEAFFLYDDAAIDEARHEIQSKALRQGRMDRGDAAPGRGKSRAGRSLRRQMGQRHVR